MLTSVEGIIEGGSVTSIELNIPPELYKRIGDRYQAALRQLEERKDE